MAANLKMKVPLACPYFVACTFMLIISAVTFVGALGMKYEFSIIVEKFLNNCLEKPMLFLIVGSILVFVNACFGVISLARRWYHGVIAFLVCTVCLFVTMIILVVVAYVFSSDTEEAIFLRLEQGITRNALYEEFINAIQFIFNCCSNNNFSDFANNPTIISQSCCAGDLPCGTTNSSTISMTDCGDALHIFLYFSMWIILVILGALGIIEVVSIVLSFAVLKNLAPEIRTSETAGTDSQEPDDSSPEMYNPLAQNSLPSVGNSNQTGEVYVRRPSLRPVVLNYQSPHESFLRHQPQLRFDKRIVLPSIKPKSPYAISPG